ncbi:MAG: hypothetical protein WBC21_03310 [Minisyncoccales bacterium]
MKEKIKWIKTTKKKIFIVGVVLLLGFLIVGANSLIASAQNSLGNSTDTGFKTDRELKELFKIAPDLFLYPPDLAPEGTVWGRDNGKIVPLAPGVPLPLEKPEELQKWPKANFPVPRITASLWYVPLFSQNDPAWKNDVIQTCGLTIGGYGCALTSDAMVFKYYGIIYQNPGLLNTCLGNYACPLYWSVAANSCSQSKATYVGAWSFSYNKLYSMLSASRPPILRLVKGNSHYVVVTSGSGTNPSNYWINDPWDGKSKQLSAYTNNGWTLSTIQEYAKR